MTDALRGMPLAWPARTLRRVLLALLTTLMLVQSVGVIHRVAHAHHASHLQTLQAPASEGANPSASTKLLARLWGEHSSLADCQLFDQMCPDLWWTPLAAWLWVGAVPIWTAWVWQVRWAPFERFYVTRGPPVALI